MFCCGKVGDGMISLSRCLCSLTTNYLLWMWTEESHVLSDWLLKLLRSFLVMIVVWIFCACVWGRKRGWGDGGRGTSHVLMVLYTSPPTFE